MAAEHMIDVEVLTPEGEVFNGEARQVSTRTEVGEIGILANHTPLLAALQPTELRLQGLRLGDRSATPRRTAGCRSSATAPGCCSRRRSPPEDLDAGALKEQLADAEQRLSESDEDSAECARAKKDRDRAEAFLAYRGLSGGVSVPLSRELSRAPCGRRSR